MLTSRKCCTELDIKIGENIKRIRLNKNLSLKAAAIPLKITFQQLKKYEDGINRISASRLMHLSKILKVNITKLFE